MSNKKTKNMDSIGNGLLSDKQKYKGAYQQPIQMREMSSRYNYVNLDEQTQPVVTMKKPSQKQYQPRVEPPPAPKETPQRWPMEQNRNPIQDIDGNAHQYPTFDNGYEPLPQSRPAPSKSTNQQQLPAYNRTNGPQNSNPRNPNPPPPQNQNTQYLPQYGGYNNPNQGYYNYQNYGYGYQQQQPYPYPYYPAQPYVCRGSQIYIPGVSHGVIRPVGVVPNATVISMNGMSFPSQAVPRQPQQQQQPTPKRPAVPDMLVTCDYCATQQNIPGNSTVFICFNCKNKVKCFPTHSIFKCDGCKSRVSYQLGTSKYIKCTRCQTINEVPVSHEEELNMSMMKSKMNASCVNQSVIEGEVMEKEEVVVREDIREVVREEQKRDKPRIPEKKQKEEVPLLAGEKEEFLRNIDGGINGEEEEFSEISEIQPRKEEANPFCKKQNGYHDDE